MIMSYSWCDSAAYDWYCKSRDCYDVERYIFEYMTSASTLHLWATTVKTNVSRPRLQRQIIERYFNLWQMPTSTSYVVWCVSVPPQLMSVSNCNLMKPNYIYRISKHAIVSVAVDDASGSAVLAEIVHLFPVNVCHRSWRGYVFGSVCVCVCQIWIPSHFSTSLICRIDHFRRFISVSLTHNTGRFSWNSTKWLT